MECFNDAKGVTWSLNVNVSSLRRVKALCGVTLTDIVVTEPGKRPDTSLLERLSSDPILLVDVLYALVKPEADVKGISDEAFGEAMAGDAIGDAVQALLEEIIAFFPNPKRAVLQKVLEAGKRFEEKQQEAVTKLLESEAFDQAMEEAALSTSSSSNAPASSESTPALTP